MKTWILLRSAEVTNDDDGNDTNDDDHCLGIVSTLSCSVTSLASSCRPGSHRAPCICRQYARHPALRLWLLRLQRTHRNSDDVTLAPPRPSQMGGPESGGWSCAILELTSIFPGIHCYMVIDIMRFLDTDHWIQPPSLKLLKLKGQTYFYNLWLHSVELYWCSNEWKAVS